MSKKIIFICLCVVLGACAKKNTNDEYTWNFSDLSSGMILGENIVAETNHVKGQDLEVTTDYLLPKVMNSMTTHWQGARPTMNGQNVIRVGGNVVDRPADVPSDQTTTHAKSYTTIKSGLDIAVHKDTRFGYMFAPEARLANPSTNDYDYKYHGLHMAIDLKFSDGTRLSQLGGTDQYGIGMHPNEQGKGKVWYQYAWNYVETQLGKVAAGKTITDIIIGFDMEDADWGHKAAGWFDDIKIFRCPHGLNYSKIALADFVDIRQGTNSSTNATGAITPSVALPFAPQYWSPSTVREGSNRYGWAQTNFHGVITSHLASRHMGERLTYLVQVNSVAAPSGTQEEINTAVRNTVFNTAIQYPSETRSDLQKDEFAYHNYHYGVTFNHIANNNVVVPGTKLEVTPTIDGAVFRFTFPAGAPARNILFDSPMVNNSDTINDAGNSLMNYTEGSHSFSAWIQRNGDDNANTTGNSSLRRKHMYGEFSAVPDHFYIPNDDNIRSMASFPELKNGRKGETVIEMRVAMSWISPAQAVNNFKMDFIASAKMAQKDAILIANWKPKQGKWFDAAKKEAKATWNETLGSIKINDPTANYWQLSDFYSKLSRSILFPTRLSEFTGKGSQNGLQYASPYRGTNANPIIMDGSMIYNEGWWDTFKSKWPLMGFLLPESSASLTDGIIRHYMDQDGRGTSFGAPKTQAPINNQGVFIGHSVPRWINPGGSNMMTGTSSDAVIADMYASYDVNFEQLMNAYFSWTKNAAVVTPNPAYGGRTGLHEGIFKGYHPWGASAPAGGGGQLDATWSLEGYINDAAQVHMLRKMAEQLTEKDIAGFGHNLEYWKKRVLEEALYYENRAKGYVHLFDSRQPAPDINDVQFSAGWFVNRNRDGNFRKFDPLNWGGGYTEDNAWPYRFLAPQDGRGLANLMGNAQGISGLKALGNALDEGFYAEGYSMEYRTSDSNSELGGYGGWIHEGWEKREVKMGQYGHSNQPAYHMPWMYLHSDRPWKAQYWTRTALARAYNGGAIGYGYMGEEDNGAMASWYVWASIGLYPLDLGSGQLVIGSPAFQNIVITNDRGRTITIKAENNSLKNVYIQSIKVNGKEYSKPNLEAELLEKDLIIEYVMGPEPNKSLYTATPPSLTKDDAMPKVLTDATYENITIVAGGVEKLIGASPMIAVTNINLTGENRASFLFDDMSDNTGNNSRSNMSKSTEYAHFSSTTAEIIYYNPARPKIEMYTLTSSATENTAPKSWTLHGSTNGKDWVELDKRSGEIFDWIWYTRPFAIAANKQEHYLYYKLEITEAAGNENLRMAEIEFLAGSQ